ncbi:hypothetical protein [Fusobacterium ulcerans]
MLIVKLKLEDGEDILIMENLKSFIIFSMVFCKLKKFTGFN